MICPHSLVDPIGFETALGDFPAGIVGAPVDALVGPWNGEMNRVMDTIAPRYLSQV